MNVSFLGLGSMGRAIARNLLAAKFDVMVWNRSSGRDADLVAAGARRAATVADASAADVVITMVADDAALESIVWKGGLAERLPRGAVHVSMSTISVSLAERLSAEHSTRGASFVAAPVFGRPDVAAAARLFIVAAGPAQALDRCQPLFDAMGQRTYRFGERASAASLVKIAGNFLLASVIESLAEAFALTRKSGIDPAQFLDLLTGTLFTAPVYKGYGALIAERRYQPAGFKLPLGLKDVTLALDAARAVTVPLPLASMLRDHMIAALAQGHADDDWSVLGEIAARSAGLD